MTITLPEFVEQFTYALDNSGILPNSFVGWKKSGRYLPSFLKGFTKLVFDDTTGRVHDTPDIQAISCIRQLGLLFKKYQAPCTESRTQKALQSYMETDSEMRNFTIESDLLDSFCEVSDVICNHLFPSICTEELVQRHGPGSTADSLRGNQKFNTSKLTWLDEWSQYFSIGNVFFANEYCYHKSKSNLKASSLSDSTVKVITVPKTLKKPRIIAMEPTATQAMQQSVKDYLVDRIEKSALTSRHVNFSDQSINKRLALENSISGTLATIDMSDASDRIPYLMVDHMFRQNRVLQDLIFLTRSQNAKVVVGASTYKIKLNKYASMGSATCFPVEALYFFIILCLYRLRKGSLPCTYSNILHVSRRIYVYGDDILIPADETEDFVTFASKFNCKVNRRKSFWKGRFRESCGCDAYNGYDITPIYCRHIPKSKRDATAIVSFTSFLNQLYSIGYQSVPYMLMSYVERHIGNLPTVEETCSGLGWLFPAPQCKRRWNKRYHRTEYSLMVPHVPRVKDPVRGHDALFKCLLHGYFRSETTPENTPVELDMSQRRGTLTLRRRWVPAR